MNGEGKEGDKIPKKFELYLWKLLMGPFKNEVGISILPPPPSPLVHTKGNL